MEKGKTKKGSKKLAKIVKQHGGQKAGVIGILQDIQTEHNHLPQEAIIYVAKKLAMPLSQLYGLATFYKAFSLHPRGKNLISVCMGTACHVRRAPKIVDELERKLNIKAGETTKDKLFTLETVNCLGCCAIGPVMVVNDQYYEQVTVDKIDSILKKYKK